MLVYHLNFLADFTLEILSLGNLYIIKIKNNQATKFTQRNFKNKFSTMGNNYGSFFNHWAPGYKVHMNRRPVIKFIMSTETV